MKKYILIASAALLALAACTKVQETSVEQEINFQVANYVQTKADASPVEFTNLDFGTYAWHHAGTAVTAFMENEQVGKKGNEWKPLSHTFFWPKTGSIDFVSYSPYAQAGGPAVTENSIAYTAYTVSDVDVMYADRAQNQTTNVETYFYNGVPTLFHHALAKLSFKVKANFTEWTDPANGSKTTWEVTLNKATLKGVYNTGDLKLDLNSDGATWKTDGWKPDTQKTMKDVALYEAEKGLVLTTTAADLYVGEDGKAQSFFVLPQTLAEGAQQLALKFHIKTTQPNKDAEGNNIVQEEDFEATLDLTAISSLAAWGMNQNIIYTICIKPTAVVDPDSPDNPTDVVITFDPALADWEVVDAAAYIQL